MKHQLLKAIAALYTIAGCIFLLGADQLFCGIMAVVCFIGASGYYDCAKTRETILLNQWYECGEYPDF